MAPRESPVTSILVIPGDAVLLATQQQWIRRAIPPCNTSSLGVYDIVFPLPTSLPLLSLRPSSLLCLTSQCWRAPGCSPVYLPFLPAYLGHFIWSQGFKCEPNTDDSQICVCSHDFAEGHQILLSKSLFSIITRMFNWYLNLAPKQTLDFFPIAAPPMELLILENGPSCSHQKSTTCFDFLHFLTLHIQSVDSVSIYLYIIRLCTYMYI